MTFDEYQKQALTTAKDEGHEVIHRTLGLVGEAGEVAEKIKKIFRDHDGDFSKLDKDAITKELGDVVWYVATLADFLGISLDDVINRNIQHLQDRKKRDVLSGSGDNR